MKLKLWQKIALRIVLGVEGFEIWLRTRALHLSQVRRGQIAARLEVSPLVVTAIEVEIQSQAVSQLQELAK
jgi:hypothetical protein